MSHSVSDLSQQRIRAGPGRRGTSGRSVGQGMQLTDVWMEGAVAVVRLMPERLTDPDVIDLLARDLVTIAAIPGVMGMVVDFARVERASTRVFAALVEARHLITARMGRMAVAGVPEDVAQAMCLVHLDKLMVLHENLDTAVDACGPSGTES